MSNQSTRRTDALQAFKACFLEILTDMTRHKRNKDKSGIFIEFRAGYNQYGKTLKLEVKINSDEYGEGVKGADFNDVLEEFYRRSGWHKDHRAIEEPVALLSHSEAEEIDYSDITKDISN